MIRFDNIKNINLNVEKTSLWLKNIIEEEGGKAGDIVCFFCNDDYLLKQNIRFLNHDTLTDVITFDYCKGKLISGDILVSVDRVKENSNIFKVDYLTELKRVILHGLLHLLKYNDKTKKDHKLMQLKEDYYEEEDADNNNNKISKENV